MKNIIYIFACCVLLAACKKENSEKIALSNFSVMAPMDQASIILQSTKDTSVVFKWQKTVATDYTLPFYTIVFDKMEGDFSKPLYKITSDKFGALDSCIVPGRELNKAAEACGVKQLATGKIKWKILASNVVASNLSDDYRVVEVTRPDGYANSPQKLFIYGDATEAGNTIGSAIQFRRLTDSKQADKKFELYTSLASGTFQIVDSTSGTPTTYYIGVNNIIKDSAGNAGNINISPATTKKPYRIVFDFTGAVPKASIAEVEWFGVWLSNDKKVVDTLTYTSNGVFQKLNTIIKWSGGKDERYKFAFKEKGNATVLYWGSSSKDNTNPTPTVAESYYYLVSNDATQYDYSFKYFTGTNNVPADITVTFSPTLYTHKIVYR